MKNCVGLLTVVVLVSLSGCAPVAEIQEKESIFSPLITRRTDLPLTQATASGDVSVTYDRDKISYRSSKYGLSFAVPPNFRMWPREFKSEKNPVGEDPPESIRKISPTSFRIVDMPDPSDETRIIEVRFNSERLSGEAVTQWVEQVISGFHAVRVSGMPRRGSRREIVVGDRIKAQRVDYRWGPGDAPTITFQTSQGTIFIYVRHRAYDDTEPFLKTIRLVN